MIEKIELKNFKCFTKEVIEFKPMTILTGVNSAGKSTIIQALLLYEACRKHKDGEMLNASKLLGINVGSPRNLLAQNYEESGEGDFEISINGEKTVFYLSRENTIDFYKQTVGKIEDIEWNLNYLNAERIGPRMFYEIGRVDQIEMDGSNASYLMERADIEKLRIPEELMVNMDSFKFSYQVECWMSMIMGDVRLDNSLNAEKVQSELKFKNAYTDIPVLPTLTGFGLSYEFSVIVAGLWVAAKGKGVLVVENPEAHLHPSAQSKVGKFLAMVADTGIQVIVETHSEHIIDGMRIQAYALKNAGQLQINYLKFGESVPEIVKIAVDEKGELSEWPDGFFDQKQLDLRILFHLRRNEENED